MRSGPQISSVFKFAVALHLLSITFYLFTASTAVNSLKPTGQAYSFLSTSPTDTNQNRQAPNSTNQTASDEEVGEDDDDSTRDLLNYFSCNTLPLRNEVILQSEVYAAVQLDITTPPPKA